MMRSIVGMALEGGTGFLKQSLNSRHRRGQSNLLHIEAELRLVTVPSIC